MTHDTPVQISTQTNPITKNAYSYNPPIHTLNPSNKTKAPRPQSSSYTNRAPSPFSGALSYRPLLSQLVFVGSSVDPERRNDIRADSGNALVPRSSEAMVQWGERKGSACALVGSPGGADGGGGGVREGGIWISPPRRTKLVLKAV